jgi:sugar phosphate isomerase/epimerase
MIVPLQDQTPFSPFLPAEWREALERVKEADYEGVELAIIDPGQVDREEIVEALESEGLRLLSITTGQAAAKEGLSLSSPDEKIRRRAVERIQAHMQFAKSFGAVVIVGSLRGADGDIELLIESLRECTAYDAEVKIALEPLNRYESRLVNTAAEALSVVERVGAQNLGLLLDTFHANIEDRNIGQAFRDAGNRLFHVHLADSNRFVPGYGHLDFEEVWDALDAIGYQQALVFEPLPKPSVEALLNAPVRLRGEWK